MFNTVENSENDILYTLEPRSGSGQGGTQLRNSGSQRRASYSKPGSRKGATTVFWQYELMGVVGTRILLVRDSWYRREILTSSHYIAREQKFW